MHEADNKLLKSPCSTSTLIAFKPRQVLLAKQQQQQKSESGPRMTKKQEQQLNHKPALIQSILAYLHKDGFSKTFKRFLKEAQIEDDNWKTSFDLEDVYSRYLEKSRDVDKSSEAHKEQDVTLEKGSGDLSGEAIGKKKKKKKDKKGLENDEGDGKGGSEETSKSKDKKEKQKLRTVSFVEDGQETKRNSDATDIPLEDCKTESKKRKKKKEVLVSEKSSDNGQKMVDQGKSLETSENGAKESKKRKLSASDEIENMEKSATGECKCRKTEDLEEAKVGVQQGKLNAEENGHVDQKEPQKSSNKEVDEITKGDLMWNGIEESTKQKSARKQQNGSAEPKTTANAFQRVKVDGVKFVDERLQDNSYWAKDGAEYGYGEKAQKILGQVKGRDFRHEKTKKKRGSYRGGQIDFQSHSIKFNYDDEE